MKHFLGKRVISMALAVVLCLSVGITASAKGFVDVDDTAWYSQHVYEAVEQGLFNGIDQTHFAPDESVTRGMLVTVLWRMCGEPGGYTSVFSDVADNAYYSEAVAWANVRGIATGITSEIFAPESPVTREQVALLLMRFADFCGYARSAGESISDYIDAAAVSDYALSAVRWIVSEQILRCVGNRIRPSEAASRAEVAACLVELLRWADVHDADADEKCDDDRDVIKGKNGRNGRDGKSAYELAMENGYQGTVQQWLESLVGAPGKDGADGKSAYEIVVSNGYTGTQEEWLHSLAGKNGKSAYEIAVDNGYVGTEKEWLASLVGKTGPAGAKGTDGANGKSAYELAVENGYQGTVQQWLESLVGAPGKNGADGKSAYEIAVKNGYLGTEEQWLFSLAGKQGDDGKSAYALAVENGFQGTVSQWLESLKGEPGKDGKDGADGVGVKTAYINGEKHLILELTDGTIIDAGFVGVEVEPVSQVVVTFVDYDGTVLKTQYVEKGASAEPPADPEREGSEFSGWRGNYVNVYADTIVVAQYEYLWVEETEVPEDAQIMNEKWTYDLTTYLESSNDYEEGYTLYDADYEWSEYGPWSSWQKTEVTESDARQVDIGYEPAVYKTQYWYDAWVSTAIYDSNRAWAAGPVKGSWSDIQCEYYHVKDWSDERLDKWGGETWSNQVGGYYQMYGQNYLGNGDYEYAWFNERTREVLVSEAYTKYRYRDREQIYTYYHFRTESLESETEVLPGEGISNIRKWVQYIP